jgi:murein DD-endopeptidase MepM/ murein hydrolase activator NlpD
MQIIVLHPRFSTKSVTLGSRHIVLIAFTFIGTVLAAAALLSYLTMRYATDIDLPFVQEMVASNASMDAGKSDRYVKENLAAMAMKLGEMQARLMRLDALGERVQGLAGVKPEEFNFKEKPGRGGALLSSSGEHGARDLSMVEFQAALNTLVKDVEFRDDYLNVVETTLMGDKIRTKLLPTIQPVNVSYNASGFGWRLDPFTGRNAFHEGIDFASPSGTPIVAAAGGVVIAAEYHHEYGNMLEIDHGNDIVTRYAHASKLYAKVGDIVRRGQHVADIGSTGRSTGAHLHFEVLVKGVQQNPHKFLSAGGSQASSAALAANR